jgi:hypothetical protein
VHPPVRDVHQVALRDLPRRRGAGVGQRLVPVLLLPVARAADRDEQDLSAARLERDPVEETDEALLLLAVQLVGDSRGHPPAGSIFALGGGLLNTASSIPSS